MKETLYESIKNINDINTLLSLKNDFNEMCEKREKELQVIEESHNLDSNSFFFIKESFENLSSNLIKTKKGSKIIKQYVNEFKKNKDLKNMFFIYENINGVDKSVNLDTFIDRMKNLVGNINETSLNKGISALKTILKEGYVEVGENAKYAVSSHNNKALDESINYVFNNTLKLDNMAKYSLCINEIKKYIDGNDLRTLSFENKVDLDEIMENFNRDFSLDTMTEEDFKLVKEINESEDKKGVFEKYKDDCLKKIDEAIDKNEEQNTCNQLFEFKTRIMKKEYNPNTIGLDVANFIELGNTVSE